MSRLVKPSELNPHPLAEKLIRGLTEDEYAALRADVAENGILQPLIATDSGLVLDGCHRLRIATELGVDVPVTRLPALTEQDCAARIVALNYHRRHATAADKEHTARALLRLWPEKSDRQIAQLACVSHPFLARIRAEMEAAGEIAQAAVREDTAGRKQPAHKPAPPKRLTLAALRADRSRGAVLLEPQTKPGPDGAAPPSGVSHEGSRGEVEATGAAQPPQAMPRPSAPVPTRPRDRVTQYALALPPVPEVSDDEIWDAVANGLGPGVIAALRATHEFTERVIAAVEVQSDQHA